MKNSILKGLLLSVFVILVLVSCNNNHRPKSHLKDSAPETKVVESKVAEPQAVVLPLVISTSFIPCGWFGDGEVGKKYVNYDSNCKTKPHSEPICIKISYVLGPKGYAGIYWLNKDCNWGQERGFDLSTRGFTRITFWARGQSGNEIVQFKAGGVSNLQYKDSFNCEPKLDVTLGLEWNQYTIDLRGKNLSNVIGGFCWVSNSAATFYLDDLRYE